MSSHLIDAVQHVALPFSVADGTQTYPGELSREEAERLSDSKCFCTSNLPGWPEWKPLLICSHEVGQLVELTPEQESVLRAQGLYPRSFTVTCADDVVYSTFEIETFRAVAPLNLPRLCPAE